MYLGLYTESENGSYKSRTMVGATEISKADDGLRVS